jgi:hypothetical protein
MASTVGQFITTQKMENLIKKNCEDPKMVVQLTHIYLALKEGLQGQNIKMQMLKKGIHLSVPYLGIMRVYIYDNEVDNNLNYQFSNLLKEDPINPLYKNNRNTPSTFFHRQGDVYFNSTTNKGVKELKATGYPVNKFYVFNQDYIVSSVKSAIDYYKRRKPENVPTLKLKNKK